METTVFVCSHILDESHPILLVSRMGEIGNVFAEANTSPREVPFVVGLNHLLDRDRTLIELQDLPQGWEAERAAVGKPWMRTPGPAR
jgi:hypothetical protein